MGSRSNTDPLDFDYRVKDGVAVGSNAFAIVEMIGI